MEFFEEWIDNFSNQIPFSEYYTMQLEASEENGLIIKLEDKNYNVNIDFGVVYSVNVTDEGLLLNCSICDAENHDCLLSRKKGILYSVKNGKYAESIRCCLGTDLFDFYGLSQYNVVTMNYLVSVISKAPPIISVIKRI